MKTFALAAFAVAVFIVLVHFQPALVARLSSASLEMEQRIDSLVSSASKKATTHSGERAILAAAAAYGSGPLELGQRSQTTECVAEGGLPDSECTPGAVFASATREIICVSGYTKTVRNVSVATKQKIYGAYGLSYPQKSGAYEADHLIPLELGGSNDIANLFPESAEPRPGFHEKDVVENYLNHEMCKGNISLAFAQQQIAENWLLVWQSLSQDQIRELRSEYAN